MTKEEKIQDVYENLGFEWKICSKYITENGVLILPTPDLKYSLKGYENLVKDENKFSAFGKEGLKLQPSELSGIYNNKGWIKIENEEDLPKENVFLECICKGNKHQATHHFMIGDEKYVMQYYSHYKIMVFNPPIF